MELGYFTKLPLFDISQNTLYIIEKSNDNPDEIERFVNMSIDKNIKVASQNPCFIGFEYINRSKYSSLEENEADNLICITHLNDSSSPLYITNINKYKYMYKKFDLEEEVIVNFPVRNTQIKFNCNMSVISNDKTEIFAMYTFSKIPDSYKIYESNGRNIQNLNLNYYKSKEQKNIKIQNLFNFNFFNKILYERSDEHSDHVKKLFNYIEQYSIFYLTEPRIYNNSLIFCNNLKDMVSGNSKLDNRFIQRYIMHNLIDTIFCDYLLKLISENIYKSLNENSIIMHVIKFIMDTKIVPNMINNYNIPIGNNVMIALVGINTISGIQNKNTFVKDYADGAQIIVDLMLTDTSDYEGCSHQFNDGSKFHLKRGDLIMYWKDSIINNNRIEKGHIKLLTFVAKINVKTILDRDYVYEQQLITYEDSITNKDLCPKPFNTNFIY